VLTRAPHEVRRKSTMDREMEIAALLDRRERVQLTPEEFEADAEQLRRAVLTLWLDQFCCAVPSSPCSTRSPTASHFMITPSWHEVPRLHCALEDRLNQAADGPRGELGVVPAGGKLDWRRRATATRS